MSNDQGKAMDLSAGISMAELHEGRIIPGRIGDEEIIVVRRGPEIFAIGAHCTHYKGPLVDGLLVGDTVRCPWHHACFSLRTGEALKAPALDPVGCWRTERQGETVFIREKLAAPAESHRRAGSPSAPESVVIVGGGAAGFAAADMLRREGYERPITMLSAEESAPLDRPNLSKDYLAGTAPEDWLPLRSEEFYAEQEIDLVLGTRVSALDVRNRRVRTGNGREYPFGALLLATGAEPIRLSMPGAEQPHVHYLRTFADSKAIADQTASVKRAVVVGASFIGLEVAASLSARGIEVHVVAPEARPMERTLGPDVGGFVQRLHESHGIVFHLGRSVSRIETSRVILDNQDALDAPMVVVGIGVRPRLELAEQAQLAIDHGILVSQYLETSAKGVYAVGDVARWPDSQSGAPIRVEHWVVAERQGQTAARNIAGRREAFNDVPFFWSQHYDVSINYVGHADKWDAVQIDGDLDGHDASITYMREGKELAVATVFRDRQSLEAEFAMESGR